MALQEDSSMVGGWLERRLWGQVPGFRSGPTTSWLLYFISLCLSWPTYKVGLIIVSPSKGCFENGTN